MFNNILTIDNKTNEYIESFFIHITDELKNITGIFNDQEKKGKNKFRRNFYYK